MAKRRDDPFAIALGSLSATAWALTIELLCWLQERGEITNDQAKRIIERARDTIREMDGVAPHPAFKQSVAWLQRHLDRWPRKRRRRRR